VRIPKYRDGSHSCQLYNCKSRGISYRYWRRTLSRSGYWRSGLVSISARLILLNPSSYCRGSSMILLGKHPLSGLAKAPSVGFIWSIMAVDSQELRQSPILCGGARKLQPSGLRDNV
jgi:hypothetical protein